MLLNSTIKRIAVVVAVTLASYWLGAEIANVTDAWWPIAGSGFCAALFLGWAFPPSKRIKPEAGYHFDFDYTNAGRAFGVVMFVLGCAFAFRTFRYEDPWIGGLAIGVVSVFGIQLLHEFVSRNGDERTR